MSMNITLVNPPYPPNAHQHPSFIPLGLGYLAAVLEKAGYAVKVIDCQAQKITYADVERELSNSQPKMVGVTSTTLTYKSALKIIKIAKKTHPNCLTVLGGCHVTFWDDKALQECPELDVVVRREGELTITEIAERVKESKPLSGILGTTLRENGQIVRNADRPYIQDLDSLPFPAHHLLPLADLKSMGRYIFPITTSRGCLYWCNFCTTVRMFGRGYRERSPKNVVDEMEFLHKKYGARQFTFYDDAFTVNQARTIQICNEILSRGLKVEWDCETRVDMITKELLQTMKDAGCIAVWFGVESGSQKVLQQMGKNFKLDQTRRAFKWAKETGLLTEASAIFGFPGETKESLTQTMKFAEQLDPILLGYYIATPYPGTPLYDYVKDNGLLKVTDFDKYDTATPTFETPTLSMKELGELRDKAYHRFYIRPTYMIRTLWLGIAHGVGSDKGGIYGIASARNAFARFLRALGYRFTSR